MIGVALAAPIVLDLENGTYRLAWTQSITRGRWIATRFSLAIVTALAVGGLLALLFTWYRVPLDKVFGRFDGSSGFDLEGIVPLGYVLFALGLGLAIGVVWRRTAPAVIAAFLGYVGSRLFVDAGCGSGLSRPVSADVEPQRPRAVTAQPQQRLGSPDRAERQSRTPVQRRVRGDPGVRAGRLQGLQGAQRDTALRVTAQVTTPRSTSRRAASGNSRGSRQRCSPGSASS